MKKFIKILVISLFLLPLVGCKKEVENGKEKAKYQYVFLVDDAIYETQTVLEGEDAVEPTPPEKEGYNFLYWDGSLTNATSDKVIKAAFRIKKYSIVFNSNGGGDIGVLIENYNTTINEFPILEREDYIFEGWYLNDVKVELPYTFKENVILTAKWTTKT
ncbi:MAG: InlB B-repeat-containing protein [Acholeplasmatales bacterium]